MGGCPRITLCALALWGVPLRRTPRGRGADLCLSPGLFQMVAVAILAVVCQG